MQSLWFTLLTCIAFMVLVGYIAYRKTRGTTNGSEGYFLAGRGLSGGFIAGSLLLTNLSAEQLVGLNGQAFRTNLSNMAWEVTAGVAVVLMGLYLLPKYLNMSITTLPEFLSKRFDEGGASLYCRFIYGWVRTRHDSFDALLWGSSRSEIV
ncbi:sodium:solute symporter family transporter [Guptibacillus hwajinpoensis]|uniref:sodium:solute symporter family transporter n=1 Tax=Guptibacillus hwajinpoensis TaxID=208199 RepID=UPI003515B386